MNPLISVRNLSVAFENKIGKEYFVLNDVSFDINRGRILGIVGESGSGKTMCSLAIMGLVNFIGGKVKKGKIYYYPDLSDKCIELLSLTENEFSKIRGRKFSMIFQEPMTSLNPVIKCGKQVAEMFDNSEQKDSIVIKNKVLELFEKVKLSSPERIYNSYPHELSGGQRQRVMIAMAISQNPQLIIADEPTTALDVTVQKNIVELLKNLSEQHQISMIFISHDLALISEIAHDICVMFRGEIVEIGRKEEILKNPQHPYTKGLISCKPPLNRRPKKLLTVNDFINNNSIQLIEVNESITEEERRKQHEKIYSSPPLISIKNLTVSYETKESVFFGKTKSKEIIKNISFDIWKGETVGLVGESGSGKTTLGKTLLRLIENNSGNIIYQGKDLTKVSSKELRKIRKNIQIIFQDPYSSLNPKMQIGRVLIEPMIVHRIFNSSKERLDYCRYILNKVGLGDEALNKYPHEFSGGQRQRISIARALVVKPELIVCDESVSALDVSIQAQVLNLLNELKNEFGLTYLFISHDLSVVRYISDRIIVLKDGQINEIAEADELFNSPKTSYTKLLLDAIPKFNF